jgi:Leucine-rich repeat (LRR) protein
MKKYKIVCLVLMLMSSHASFAMELPDLEHLLQEGYGFSSSEFESAFDAYLKEHHQNELADELKRLIESQGSLHFNLSHTKSFRDIPSPEKEVLLKIVLGYLAERKPHLQELFLTNIGLRELPSEIGKLSELRELWLGNNSLVHLPKELGNLTFLTKVTVARNRLVDLPQEMSLLVNLRELKIEGNAIRVLPVELFPALVKLDQFTGLESNSLVKPEESILVFDPEKVPSLKALLIHFIKKSGSIQAEEGSLPADLNEAHTKYMKIVFGQIKGMMVPFKILNDNDSLVVLDLMPVFYY